jgi:hypothetical protein
MCCCWPFQELDIEDSGPCRVYPTTYPVAAQVSLVITPILLFITARLQLLCGIIGFHHGHISELSCCLQSAHAAPVPEVYLSTFSSSLTA